jgi:hypothetical protein
MLASISRRVQTEVWTEESLRRLLRAVTDGHSLSTEGNDAQKLNGCIIDMENTALRSENISKAQ